MKNIINTELAPKAIGPYSQGTCFERLVFTSGQLPLDPNTMELVSGGIKEQAYQSLINLKVVLEEAGASLDSVLKTTCFLSDIKDFVAFNEVYAEVFGNIAAPARSCLEVACLPKDALIEVEAIASIKQLA